MKSKILFAALLCFCITSFSQTYTLNSAAPTAGTNFNSFTDLATFLNGTTLTGPVIVNLDSASGPYTEQFKLNVIAGASTSNSVTINGSGRTLQYDAGTNSTDRATLEFDGTDYVRVNILGSLG